MEATINQQRKMGIEIECVLPIIGRGSNEDVQSLLAQVLTNHGVRACSRGYTHRSLPQDCQLAIEHDTSIRDESRYRGLSWSKIEVKTAPMLWEEVERILPQALDIIRYCGARTNASCGLHVHHHLPEVETRPQVARSLQHLWWRWPGTHAARHFLGPADLSGMPWRRTADRRSLSRLSWPGQDTRNPDTLGENPRWSRQRRPDSPGGRG